MAADREEHEPHRAGHLPGGAAGLLGAAHARVEADEHPPAHRQRRQQGGAHRAAREGLGAEGLAEQREVLLAKGEQQHEPDAHQRDHLGRDAAPTTRLRTPMPHIPTSAHTTTRTMPVRTSVLAVGSIPSSVSAQGAPR